MTDPRMPPLQGLDSLPLEDSQGEYERELIDFSLLPLPLNFDTQEPTQLTHGMEENAEESMNEDDAVVEATVTNFSVATTIIKVHGDTVVDFLARRFFHYPHDDRADIHGVATATGTLYFFITPDFPTLLWEILPYPCRLFGSGSLDEFLPTSPNNNHDIAYGIGR